MNILRRRFCSSFSSAHVNCPTTRPAAWPIPNSSSSRWKKIYTSGKAYVNLYKLGIKNVWKNQRDVRRLKIKYNFSNIDQLTRYCLNGMFVQNISKPAEQRFGPLHLTRSEYQLVLRTKNDMTKLPFFALVFAIFFEMTPIIVALFPRLTPLTCYTPNALKNHLATKEAQISAMRSVKKSDSEFSEKQLAQSVHFLTRQELKVLASFTNKTWLPPFFYTRSHMENIINAYIREIRCDNMLLARFGGSDLLDTHELALACLERGISVKDKDDDRRKKDLKNWIETWTENHYDAGFLLRSQAQTRDRISDRQ